MPLNLYREQEKLHTATSPAQGENTTFVCIGGSSGADQIGTNFAQKPLLKLRNALDNSFSICVALVPGVTCVWLAFWG